MKDKTVKEWKDTSIRNVSKEELVSKSAILIDNVEAGFEAYEYVVLQGRQEAFVKFLNHALQLNGITDSYADFYYNRLSEEQKEYFHKALSKEDLDYLRSWSFDEGIYYNIDEKFMDFLLRITMEELLFSTFYFTRYPCTVWGNYGLKFPVFFRDSETKVRYLELAKACELKNDKN